MSWQGSVEETQDVAWNRPFFQPFPNSSQAPIFSDVKTEEGRLRGVLAAYFRMLTEHRYRRSERLRLGARQTDKDDNRP